MTLCPGWSPSFDPQAPELGVFTWFTVEGSSELSLSGR